MLSGLGGDDELVGYFGNDTLLRGAGDDTLDGYFGDDIVQGGAGADTLRGGDGIDTLSYADGAAGVTVELNVIDQFGSATVEGDTVYAGFENLQGSAVGGDLPWAGTPPPTGWPAMAATTPCSDHAGTGRASRQDRPGHAERRHSARTCWTVAPAATRRAMPTASPRFRSTCPPGRPWAETQRATPIWVSESGGQLRWRFPHRRRRGQHPLGAGRRRHPRRQRRQRRPPRRRGRRRARWRRRRRHRLLFRQAAPA